MPLSSATSHLHDVTPVHRSRSKVQRAMEHATDYDTWFANAEELERKDGVEEWKDNPISTHYQYDLIGQRLANLQTWRRQRDWPALIFSLREGLHRNLGNLGNPELYQTSQTGTKRLIDDYISEVNSLLNYLCDHEIPDFPYAEKVLFFKQTGHSFGRSALMLSGGANMGVFHVGVLKALWEQKLLPRVLSGSSAGAVMASIVGTRVDSELKTFFNESTIVMDAWKRHSVKSIWRKKALMDSKTLEAFVRHQVGEYTFEEAYRRTKRIINITASPVGRNNHPRLLNYLTTPHLTVWSAVMASSAVPGLFAPVTLMAKDRSGQFKPYMPTLQWVDGSLKSDLPARRLAELYNVNHHIVSQTNPHVLPFLTDQHKKEGVGSLLTNFVKDEVQFHSKLLLQLAARGLGTGMLRQVVDHAAALVEQQYYGDITIHPGVRLGSYMSLVSNISDAKIRAMALQGEQATWPKIAMIRDQTIIGQTLEDCIQRLKRQRRQKVNPQVSI